MQDNFGSIVPLSDRLRAKTYQRLFPGWRAEDLFWAGAIPDTSVDSLTSALRNPISSDAADWSPARFVEVPPNVRRAILLVIRKIPGEFKVIDLATTTGVACGTIHGFAVEESLTDSLSPPLSARLLRPVPVDVPETDLSCGQIGLLNYFVKYEGLSVEQLRYVEPLAKISTRQLQKQLTQPSPVIDVLMGKSRRGVRYMTLLERRWLNDILELAKGWVRLAHFRHCFRLSEATLEESLRLLGFTLKSWKALVDTNIRKKIHVTEVQIRWADVALGHIQTDRKTPLNFPTPAFGSLSKIPLPVSRSGICGKDKTHATVLSDLILYQLAATHPAACTLGEAAAVVGCTHSGARTRVNYMKIPGPIFTAAHSEKNRKLIRALAHASARKNAVERRNKLRKTLIQRAAALRSANTKLVPRTCAKCKNAFFEDKEFFYRVGKKFYELNCRPCRGEVVAEKRIAPQK